MGNNLGPNGLSRVAGFSAQVDMSQIIVHEGDEPDVFVDFLDADPLSRQHGRDVDAFAVNADTAAAVARTSRSCMG
jgi:hypothetical protein